MIKHLNQLLIISCILISCILINCSDECKTFDRTALSHLPPNLEKRLSGLINYSNWLLTNQLGDTLFISAQNEYTVKERIVQNGGSSVCTKGFQGSRVYDFFISKNGVHGNPIPFNLNIIYGTTTEPYRLHFFFRNSILWNYLDDSPFGNNNISWYDSISLNDSTYYNVFYENSEYPDSEYLIISDSLGFLAESGSMFSISQPLILTEVY